MSPNFIQTVATAAPLQRDRASEQGLQAAPFSGVLDVAAQARLSKPGDVRDAAAQFVGIALIQPLLAQLHTGQFASEPFGPSDIERRFSPMFDGLLSDRIAKASNFSLTEAVVRYLNSGAADGVTDNG